MSSSTAAPSLKKFVVWAPDSSEPDTFERRTAMRARHLEGARELRKQGLIWTAGPMVAPDTVDAPLAEKKLIGSVLVCEADNIETVKKAVYSDIYYLENIWDKEKLTIVPWLTVNLD
ncbi:uncharacterized protein FIBRA_01237 [Fibroporia radiculosa]|uniref:YCII-related domain-containing protein n=1 Tax=Fibroporia radiculosa TaxID=599839 RepID=J4HSZ9_9APHY|nr:uncharacterized protein FIBRA_01237 [Fibroporia radiculosa]CCL99222.1 predicted protein [Fibroporia radiculosa]